MNHPLPLTGHTALITAGPTYEPIDPVRFIGNRSSGKQGFAIAKALAGAGADVTLITGPVALNDLDGVTMIRVETAQQMHDACLNALPVDIAICAAAVSDWSPVYIDQKIKKQDTDTPPAITLTENPDILKTIANHKNRPTLVVGFAAETQNLIENAHRKLSSKNCDIIIANDVSQNVFGTDQNHVYLLSKEIQEEWPTTSKDEIARQLAKKMSELI